MAIRHLLVAALVGQLSLLASASVCTKNELAEKDWCKLNGKTDYLYFHMKDSASQARNSDSVMNLVKMWMQMNPNATARDRTRGEPLCRNALSRYLCRSAMPPCHESSASCNGKFYPCMSMCKTALKECIASRNPEEEKGGFGWLRCKDLPTHSEEEDTSGNMTVPVPTGCCVNTTYTRGDSLPFLHSAQCEAKNGKHQGIDCSGASTLSPVLAMTVAVTVLASLFGN